MLDRDGFRPNVGIILLNQKNQVFWGKRIRTHSWQFPQGGIDRGETPEQAMYRELGEEVGLQPDLDAWRWNDYWVPLDMVVEFKRGVYEMALTELARFLPRHDHRSGFLRQGNRGRELEQMAGTASHKNTIELPPGATFEPDPQTNTGKHDRGWYAG